MACLNAFLRDDESGTTAVEYAVLLGLIIGTLVMAITAVGNGSGGMWGNNKTQLERAFGAK